LSSWRHASDRPAPAQNDLCFIQLLSRVWFERSCQILVIGGGAV